MTNLDLRRLVRIELVPGPKGTEYETLAAGVVYSTLGEVLYTSGLTDRKSARTLAEKWVDNMRNWMEIARTETRPIARVFRDPSTNLYYHTLCDPQGNEYLLSIDAGDAYELFWRCPIRSTVDLAFPLSAQEDKTSWPPGSWT